MQINLYVCNAERNRVDKSSYLTNRFPLNGNIKRSTAITNPIIEIEKTNPVLSQYNYLYIPDFNRFYFIDEIRNISANRWEIIASVDVLFSFMTDIKTSEAVLDKTENVSNANLYFNDGSFKTDCRKDNQTIEFPNGLNSNGEYILICAGGV